MKKHKFIVKRPDDETLIILLDGEEVGTATHDSDGWKGMKNLLQLATKVAKVLNIPIEVSDEEDDGSRDS